MSRKQYTVSVDYDQRLYKQDIAGSIVHVQMLAKQDIISTNEADKVCEPPSEILELTDSNILSNT